MNGRKQANNVHCGVLVLAVATELLHRKQELKDIETIDFRYWIADQCMNEKHKNQSHHQIHEAKIKYEIPNDLVVKFSTPAICLFEELQELLWCDKDPNIKNEGGKFLFLVLL